MPQPIVVEIQTEADLDTTDLRREFDALVAAGDETAERIGQSFAGIDAETSGAFDGLGRAARAEADDVIRAFDVAGDELGRAFEQSAASVERDLSGIERSFDGIAQAARVEADEAGRAFDDAGNEIASALDNTASDIQADVAGIGATVRAEAAGIEAPFDDAARNIGASFDSVGTRVRADLGDISDEARRAASDLDEPFDNAARQIGSSFDSVGSRVRSDLADISASADTAASRIPPPFDRAADDVSSSFDDAGNEVADKLQGIGDDIDFGAIGSSIGKALTGGLTVLGPAAGVAANLFADNFVDGFERAWSRNRNRTALIIQTGFNDVDLAAVGEASGNAYSAGFGSSLADVKNTAATVRGELTAIDSSLNLTRSTRQAQLLADVFGIDIPTSINLSRRLIAQDLVGDTEQAFSLIAATAQTFGLNFEEILEVLNEFSPVFARMGIDGERAAQVIGTLVQEGQLTNVDRAAELFEEFNIRLAETGTLDEPLKAINVDIERMQSLLAEGRGDEALVRITKALLDIEDPARRDALALEIFGASIESAADKARVLEVLSTSNLTGDLTADIEELAQAYEDTVPPIDKLQRRSERLGEIYASGINKELDLATRFLSSYREEAELAGNVLGFLTEKGQSFTEFATRAVGVTDDLAEASKGSGRSLNDLDAALARAAASSGTLIEPFAQFEGSANAAADGVDRVQQSLDSLFNFSADQSLRNIASATDRLTEALTSADASAVLLNGDIDIMAQGGAQAQAAFEALSLTQQRNIQAFNEGEISAEQFAVANARVEAGLRQAAEAAGLTQAQTQGLIDKYFAVPDEVSTVVRAVDAASLTLAQIARNVDLIPNQKTITVNARRINFRGVIDQFASGGRSSGGPAIVGEDGPEIVDLPPGSFVHDAADTRRLLSNSRRVASTARLDQSDDLAGEIRRAVDDAVRQPAGINIENVMVDPRVSLWQSIEEADAVYRAVAR